MKEKRADSMGLTRRKFIHLSALGIAGASLAGGSEFGWGAEKKPKYGGRLRVGERYHASSLDPYTGNSLEDFQTNLMMYSSLTDVGELQEVQVYPMLAKSWEISKDGREYVFALREGVKFHDGKELDSGDVKYSMEWVMNPASKSPRRAAYIWVESVNIVDKYHVKFKLKEPYAPFLTTLTIRNCPIIPAGSKPTGSKVVPGTGPFVFKSFVPNESSEFTRFGQYWEYDEKTGDRLPYLDEVYIKKIIDPMVRWSALRAGDMDYVNAIPRNLAAKEAKDPTPGTVTIIAQPVGMIRLVFNVTKAPFDNKKVRHAVTYAIDKKELITAAWFDLGVQLNNQAFPNGSRFYVPLEDRKPDVAKAKQLLAEAGYPNGFKVEFVQYSASSGYPVCQAVIGQLRKIGIEGSMKIVDQAVAHVITRKGEFGMNVVAVEERLDPDDAYYLLFHSSQIGQTNDSRYSNKEVDALLEKGRTTWQREQRMAIYKKMLEILKEDLPVFFLGKQISPVTTRDYVRGRIGGMSTWLGYHQGGLKTVWLDK